MHAICWDVDDIRLCLGLDCVGPFDVGRLFSSYVEFALEASVAHVCRRLLTKLEHDMYLHVLHLRQLGKLCTRPALKEKVACPAC